MKDNRHFIVVGASQAGCWISKTLRQEGFLGKVTLIGDEDFYPYERPPLSKDLLLGTAEIESTYFFDPKSYEDDKIEVLLNTRVEKIQPEKKTIMLENGREMAWDRLAIATGSRVRSLEVDGSTLSGIYYLRDLNDSKAIKDSVAEGTNAVIVGGGWIGLECAASLKKLGCNPTVVESSERLCMRAVNSEMSEWMREFHVSNGIDVRLGTCVDKFNGDKAVTSVSLSDNSTISCTLVIIGIGVIPNIELAKQAGLLVSDGIVVDQFCKTSNPNIFSAGDVANHPNRFLDRRVRLESWDNAMKQGISAAKSMLEKGQDYSEIPWFWSQQFDANIQILGLPVNWEECVVRGDRTANKFIEFYLKDNLITGAVAINNNRELKICKRLMQLEQRVNSHDLADLSIKMQSLVQSN